ncbi:unnamed protein product [Moneuplotes crassus]|uniref:Uncharacterized protein n=1 Tax=Euplotes crassus TaxID=5936 RepID=A0AAD1X9L8_EUPCR|nr:unnamed protein product [Moneuplotes crassus]
MFPRRNTLALNFVTDIRIVPRCIILEFLELIQTLFSVPELNLLYQRPKPWCWVQNCNFSIIFNLWDHHCAFRVISIAHLCCRSNMAFVSYKNIVIVLPFVDTVLRQRLISVIGNNTLRVIPE